MHSLELTPNSPAKRFDYVVRTYEGTDRAPIIFDVAWFAAHLFGLDRRSRAIRILRSRYTIAVYGPGVHDVMDDEGRPYPEQDVRRAAAGGFGPRRPFDPAAASLALAELKALMDRDLPRQHRYEALLPWAATKLAKLFKAAEQAPRRAVAVGNYHNAVDELVQYGTAIGTWWEANKPDLGRVSIEEAVRHAREAESGGAAERAEVVWTFDDGYTVQKLTTPSQLETEGDAMQHCVGSYCEFIESGDVQVFSLRDPQEHPHVTLEWDNKTKRWLQIKGKQNEKPVEKYWPYLETFVGEYVPVGASEPDERGLGLFGGPAEMEQAALDMGLEIQGYTGDEPLEAGQQIAYGDLGRVTDDTTDRVVVVPYATGSDYSGDVTNRANYEAILRDYEDHPDVHAVYGGHGTYGIAINVLTPDESLVEMVGAMHEYPCYDEEFDSQFRMEKADEDWENWGEADFRSVLEEEITEPEAVEVFDDTFDWLQERGEVRTGFEAMREDANVYWEPDGPNMHVDLKRVLADSSAANLLVGLVGAYQGLDYTTEPYTLTKIRNAMQKLLGSERAPSAKELDAIIAALWMEGIQPEFALPFDEAQMKRQLRDAGVAQRSIDQLTPLLSGEREQAYVALADAWIVLSNFWKALEGLHREKAPVDDVIVLLHESIPVLDQIKPVVESLESR